MGLGMPRGQPLSPVFQISTLLQNYISILIISKKIRTIPSVVSEISSGQIFAVLGTPVGQP